MKIHQVNYSESSEETWRWITIWTQASSVMQFPTRPVQYWGMRGKNVEVALLLQLALV